MTAAAMSVLTPCLCASPNWAPAGSLAAIDSVARETLTATGNANTDVIKALNCRTVAKGPFAVAYRRNGRLVAVDAVGNTPSHWFTRSRLAEEAAA